MILKKLVKKCYGLYWDFIKLVTRSLNLIVTEIDRSIALQHFRKVLDANDREFAIKTLIYTKILPWRFPRFIF